MPTVGGCPSDAFQCGAAVDVAEVNGCPRASFRPCSGSADYSFPCMAQPHSKLSKPVGCAFCKWHDLCYRVRFRVSLNQSGDACQRVGPPRIGSAPGRLPRRSQQVAGGRQGLPPGDSGDQDNLDVDFGISVPDVQYWDRFPEAGARSSTTTKS